MGMGGRRDGGRQLGEVVLCNIIDYICFLFHFPLACSFTSESDFCWEQKHNLRVQFGSEVGASHVFIMFLFVFCEAKAIY